MQLVTARRIYGVLISLSLLLPAACNRDETQQPTDARTSASGDGVITGRVTYSGPPDMKIIPGSPEVPDESTVTGPHNGLKNVIVFLKDAPKPSFSLTTPVVLDQIKCVYVPHVVAIETGQILRLKSSDNLMHNVHLKCQVNPDSNFGFPNPGQMDMTLTSPEAPFPVKCDVHPWMGAWIGVFNHPWFAVTSDDGKFTIQHVPPGKYALAAWQEVLPQQEQQIVVNATGSTEADFQFKAP